MFYTMDLLAIFPQDGRERDTFRKFLNLFKNVSFHSSEGSLLLTFGCELASPFDCVIADLTVTVWYGFATRDMKGSFSAALLKRAHYQSERFRELWWK